MKGPYGPYRLTEKSIDEHVPEGCSGTYELLTLRLGHARYVGESLMDLNERLKEHLGEGYTHFRFIID